MAEQISQTTDLDELVGTYYDRIMLETLTPQLYYAKDADVKPLPAHGGATIQWARLKEMWGGAAGGLLTEGTTPYADMLSAINVTATLVQKGRKVRISDLLDTVGVCDVTAETVKLLADDAARMFDSHIWSTIGASVGTNSLYTKTTAGQSFDFFAYSGGTWGLHAGGSANKMAHEHTHKIMFSADCVKPIVTQLKKWNAKPFADGYYHAIIHPHAADQMRKSAGWATWHQYTNPEAKWKGEIGEYEQVKFFESTNAGNGGLGVTSAKGKFYATLICGQHAYGTVDVAGLGGIKTYSIPASKIDKSDLLAQYGLVGYKMTTAAAILNESCGIIAFTTHEV